MHETEIQHTPEEEKRLIALIGGTATVTDEQSKAGHTRLWDVIQSGATSKGASGKKDKETEVKSTNADTEAE